MKKYISTILINVVLVQLVGCYSQKTITYDEFYSLPKKEKTTVKIYNGDTFELDSDSLKYNYIKWDKSTKGLTIYPTHREKYSSNRNILITDTLSYSKYQIKEISINEFDLRQTFMGIGLVVGLVALLFIAANNM